MTADADSGVRVLFCLGVRAPFFDAPERERTEVLGVIRSAFRDLGGRFGLTVLGTLDDDELMVGPSDTYPWTAYILADAPDTRAVTRVCDLLRATDAGEAKLWRYLKVEARVGRPLFFGNE